MVVFIPLWYLECKEEEKELMESQRQEYADYEKRTGMFFPIRD
jgi:protein-S-isoprenylcysteine O-methyltransferase Ste14